MAADVSTLDLLAANRESLLLAELGAWLHDMGKGLDAFVNNESGYRYKVIYSAEELRAQLREIAHSPEDSYWYNKSIEGGKDEWPGIMDEAKTAPSSLYATLTADGHHIPPLLDHEARLSVGGMTHTFTVRQLILFSEPGFIFSDPFFDDNLVAHLKCRDKGLLHQYLGRAHGAAHIEKEDSEGGPQMPVALPSSPFGIEGDVLAGLTDRMRVLLAGLPITAGEFVKERDPSQEMNVVARHVSRVLQDAIADRRRPINEVTLWDWGHIAAALYKAALAGAVLDGRFADPLTLQWRLLFVRFDGARVVEHVAAIPALLARKKWLGDGLDRVRRLLEWQYPLGTEVYRDENGAIFVVPDLPDLIDMREHSQGPSLRALIAHALGFDGELVVTPQLDREAWWAQRPVLDDPRGRDQLPPIGARLSTTVRPHADPQAVRRWWGEAPTNAFPCAVSLVRPQGSGVAAERKMSSYWLQRVNGRAKEWWDNRAKEGVGPTIWIDEVADASGRLCVVAGRFALDVWLTEPSMISSIRATLRPVADAASAAQAREGTPSHIGKRASFARLRRIWDTTRRFWLQTEGLLPTTAGVASACLRCTLSSPDLKGNHRLRDNYAYEIDIDGVRLGVYCHRVAPGHPETVLISTGNLLRVARLLGASRAGALDHVASAAYVVGELGKRTRVSLWEPGGYGVDGVELGTIALTGIQVEELPYVPAVVLQSDPRSFIALVPADHALAVADDIRKRYDAQIGKVRNRLPLVLGLTFADARTPLPALLDAGRRMLRQPCASGEWVVVRSARKQEHGAGHTGVWRIELEQGDRRVRVDVPTQMASNHLDQWYPYWRLSSARDAETASERPNAFRWGGALWVRAMDLRRGDTVYYAPSPLDIEFLDSAARRFEIAYGPTGRRGGSAAGPRPYHLEHLPELIGLWNLLLEGGLTTSGIKNLIGTVETKRDEWGESDADPVFARFAQDAVHEADWVNRPSEADMRRLAEAAASGLLAAVVGLHMSILDMKVGE